MKIGVRGNPCDWCIYWDNDYQTCIDEEIFVDSTDGMPCCRHNTNAAKYSN